MRENCWRQPGQTISHPHATLFFSFLNSTVNASSLTSTCSTGQLKKLCRLSRLDTLLLACKKSLIFVVNEGVVKVGVGFFFLVPVRLPSLRCTRRLFLLPLSTSSIPIWPPQGTTGGRGGGGYFLRGDSADAIIRTASARALCVLPGLHCAVQITKTAGKLKRN